MSLNERRISLLFMSQEEGGDSEEIYLPPIYAIIYKNKLGSV
jgi:hypothetical protein